MSIVGTKRLLTSLSDETRNAETIASLAGAALKDDIQAFGQASLMISSCAEVDPILPRLFTEQIDWQHVSIGLVSSPVQSGELCGASRVERALRPTPAAKASFLHMGGLSCDPEVDAKFSDDAYLMHLPISFTLMTMADDGNVPGWGTDYKRFSGETDRAVDWCSDIDEIPGSYQLALTRAALSQSRRAALVLVGEGQRRTFEDEMQKFIYQSPLRGIVEDLGAKLFVFCLPA